MKHLFRYIVEYLTQWNEKKSAEVEAIGVWDAVRVARESDTLFSQFESVTKLEAQ